MTNSNVFCNALQIAVCTRGGRVQCVSTRSGRVLCQYQLDISACRNVRERKQAPARQNDKKRKPTASAAATDSKSSAAATANPTAAEEKQYQIALDHPIKGVGVLGRRSGAGGQRAFVTCLESGKIQVLRFPAGIKSEPISDDADSKAAASGGGGGGGSGSGSVKDEDDEAEGEGENGSGDTAMSAASAASAEPAAPIDPALLAPTPADIVREFEAGNGICRLRVYDGIAATGEHAWFASGGKERLLSVWDANSKSDKPVWSEKNVSGASFFYFASFCF